MKADGDVAWSQELDFTLWDAVVTDAGTVVGYAYSWGQSGWCVRDPAWPKENVVWVVVLDAGGNVVSKDPRPRVDTKEFICAPTMNPSVQSLAVFEDHDTIVLRATSADTVRDERLWVYRLSTGERIRECAVTTPGPDSSGNAWIQYETRLHGAPAMLMLWEVWRRAGEAISRDARLSIVDFEGREVWGKDFVGEYAEGVDSARRRLRFDAGSFRFTSAALGTTVRYSWTLGPDGRVSEQVTESLAASPMPALAAHPTTDPAPAAADSTATEIALEEVAKLSLRDNERPPSVFGEIFDFSIDGKGQLGWVRRAGDRLRFTIVDQTGVVVHDRELPGMGTDRLRQAVWCSGDRWVVFDSGIGDSAAAWWYDTSTGELTPMPELAVGGLRCVAPLPDGGLVGQAGADWVRADSIKAFEPSGKERWSIDVSSVQDVAVNALGEIVVLQGIRGQLQFFDTTGKELRSLDLKTVLGKEPNYVAGLDRSIDGGLILHDFNGRPPVYRLDKNSGVQSTLDPRYADGRQFSIMGHVQAAPDGTLWTSDGVAFLRLDETGVVTHVLGDAPAERPLDVIAGFTVGPDGRIYAVNERSGALHVFEANGAAVGVHRPDPTDFAVRAHFASVTIDGDGSIYYNTGNSSVTGGKGGYLHLAPDGSRIGWEALRLGEVREEWLFQPKSSRRWALGYEFVGLLEADGSMVKEIRRRPNGDWIGRVDGGAVGPDGSLALVADDAEMGMGRGPVVCVYSPAGDPIQQIAFGRDRGAPRIAYAPPFLIAVTDDVLLYDLRSPGAPKSIRVPRDASGNHNFWDACATPDGRSVLLRESGTSNLLQLRLPLP